MNVEGRIGGESDLTPSGLGVFINSLLSPE